MENTNNILFSTSNTIKAKNKIHVTVNNGIVSNNIIDEPVILEEDYRLDFSKDKNSLYIPLL